MEKSDKEQYHSKTLLGKMYGRVKEHPLGQLLEPDAGDVPSSSGSSYSGTPGGEARHAAFDSGQQTSRLPFAGLTRFVVYGSSLRGWQACLEHSKEAAAFLGRDLLSLMNKWHVYDVGEKNGSMSCLLE